MKVRIYRSLLLMGIISVVVTFILSAVLYYQGMQEQFSHELQHLNRTMAMAVSLDQEDSTKDYLKQVYDDNHGIIHIVWLDRDGSVLYDSDNITDEDYAAGEEVKEAMDKGTGEAVHRDAKDSPKSYYAQKAPDGSILRLSSARVVSYKGFSAYLPEIMLFLLVFVVGCLFAAERETEKILKPFHLLGDLVQQIMEGKKVSEVPSDYKELNPLIRKVEEQHNEIESYLEDIEDERNTIRTVIDTISDGIILLNERKEILDYNRQIEEIFKPAEDKRFRRIASLYHDQDWLRVIGKAYRIEGRQEYTMNLFGKPYRMVMQKTELSNGETGLLIVLRDMTASYMAEKMRREFSANVSHELKTPLQSISGYAEIINAGIAKPEDVPRFVAKIGSEAARLIEMVDNILKLSRLDEGGLEDQLVNIDLKSVVSSCCQRLEERARTQQVELMQVLPERPVSLRCVPAVVDEIVFNLVENAIKYNQPGGRVTVSLPPDSEGTVQLRVRDTGKGIAKEDQQRIFERFYRGEKSHTGTIPGNGLGLALVKHGVLLHKGTINLASTPGEGTVITVTFGKL